MTDDNKRAPITRQVSDIFTVSFSSEESPPIVVGVPDKDGSEPDFEEAVEATGYGLFNYFILLALLPGAWTNSFDTTAIAYVLTSAECDLKLTLNQKGMLNAAIYAGMIPSAFVWGFLADTRGRRSLLLYGYLADFICNLFGSMSQSFYVILAFKYLSGCLISGPFAISMAYMAEFHGTKHRSKALLWARMYPSLASIFLPGLAWLIISQPWSFTFLDGTFVYNSWRIFLTICGTPALLAFLVMLYLPESPMFLMAQGRNDEALKVFQRMYATNTGNSPETFPVKALRQEVQKNQIERSDSRVSLSVWESTRRGLNQIKPLFTKPYLSQFILITIIQFGGLLGLNTLRLWMPEIFTLMENFDYENFDTSLGAPTLCDMLSQPVPPNVTVIDDFNSTITDTCVVVPVLSAVYINSIIIAVTMVLGFTIAGTLVNLLGNKNLLHAGYAIPAICSFLLNWSPNSDVTLAIFAIYTAFTSIAVTVIISVMVELMPTSLRTTAVSLTMCFGRSGAMIGNLLFPILLNAGCMGPFIFVGGFLLVCLVLSIFVPKPSAKLM